MPKFIPIRPVALVQQDHQQPLHHTSETDDLISSKFLGPKKTFVPLLPRAFDRSSRECVKDSPIVESLTSRKATGIKEIQRFESLTNKKVQELNNQRSDESPELHKFQNNTLQIDINCSEQKKNSGQLRIPKLSHPAKIQAQEHSQDDDTAESKVTVLKLRICLSPGSTGPIQYPKLFARFFAKKLSI